MKESFLKIVWQNLLTLILLNLAFIFSSVFVITIPAATTGLYRGACCCLDDRKRVLAEYWKAFRQNLIYAIPVGLFFGAFIAASAYGCVFYRMNYTGQFILLPISIFCLIVLYLSYIASIYAFTMLATVELPRKKIIKNAFLLLLVDVKSLFTWTMLSAVALLLSILLFPRSLVIIILLSFSISAILGAKGAIDLIKQYIMEGNNE